MSLTMNNFSHHAPSPSTHHHSLTHLQHPNSHHSPDTHQHSTQGHFSIRGVPEPGRTYPLNAVRHSSRDDLSYTSYSEQPRYSRQLMQPQPERRSNSPYHHMMNVPQVQQAPLPPPHAPMHDPNSPAPGVPYDFPQEYAPPNPGPSDFHHPPPMYRPDVNPVPAQAPPPMQGQQNPTHGSRPLNNSKRAEQNRKAQRAFRERRDQHVKQLESRSAMLDVALANADEANRRLEDQRILVEQLRAENQALRTTLALIRSICSSARTPALTTYDPNGAHSRNAPQSPGRPADSPTRGSDRSSSSSTRTASTPGTSIGSISPISDTELDAGLGLGTVEFRDRRYGPTRVSAS
ncbi:bZIP transcription factor domain-containing protein [Rhizoctonia solani AG-1 IA]|uniref:BZIP transcription factor domain-containing protein n=1 Tax=Thanatephorus cucumeris (strain AG1-IA) TaxID=983506 RepID=L8WX28_THACA|nr:bZIP transcription factor domain-containing protein [Rhizoctonia solani AG-1 IA]